MGLLQLISAAVTPVVMISACATIILGINAKHTGAADRVRELATRYRDEAGESEERKANLREQVQVFYRRFLISRASLWMLFMAIAVFIACVLTILASQKRMLSADSGAFFLFLIGVSLMFSAVCLEFAELHLSKRSLFLEVRDLVSPRGTHRSLAASLARFVLGERESNESKD